MSKMSNLHKILMYWTIVFHKAWKIAIEGSGIRGIAITVILAFLIFGTLSLLSSLHILPPTYGLLIGDSVSEIRTQLMYSIISIASLILIFIFSLVYIPAKIYEEQGGFVDNPFEIVARPPLRKKKDEFRYASLTIINTSEMVIKDCFVTLDDIIDKNNNSVLFSRQRRLSWSSGEGLDGNLVNKELNIIPGEPRICDVATTAPNNSEVTITVWRGTQSFRAGKYKVVITAHGQWDNRPIRKKEEFILTYRGKNLIKLEKEK